MAAFFAGFMGAKLDAGYRDGKGIIVLKLVIPIALAILAIAIFATMSGSVPAPAEHDPKPEPTPRPLPYIMERESDKPWGKPFYFQAKISNSGAAGFVVLHVSVPQPKDAPAMEKTESQYLDRGEIKTFKLEFPDSPYVKADHCVAQVKPVER